jgi:2-isopropylmalate synthase
MTKDRLYLFDTTLRDGAQTSGVDFSVNEKIVIAELLERLGVDYVEGGYPGANPADTEFFSQKRTKNAAFTAFGMTKRAGRSASNDPGLQQILASQSDACCFVAKAWDYHVDVALGCTNEENLEAIEDTVKAAVMPPARKRWSTASISSTATRPIRTMRSPARRQPIEAGARWIVLCDTNGGTLPTRSIRS